MTLSELFQYESLVQPFPVGLEGITLDKWNGFSDPVQTEPDPVHQGGMFGVILPGFNVQKLDWLLAPNTPSWEAETAPEGFVTSPWLRVQTYEPYNLDWQATVPDPVPEVDANNGGMFVSPVADYMRPLDWIGEAQPPAASIEPLADYALFTIPQDPLNPQLTPFIQPESTVVWETEAAQPTPQPAIFAVPLGEASLEWQPVSQQPDPEPTAIVALHHAQPLSIDIQAFTWFAPAIELPADADAAISTQGHYVAEPAVLGLSGWIQPVTAQQFPGDEPMIYAMQSDFSDMTTAALEGLTEDNRNVDGM